MHNGEDWEETARLLAVLARLVEQQPDADDPFLDLAYVPRSQLGHEHRWEVNLNLGSDAKTFYWTGAAPDEVLRAATSDLRDYLSRPTAFLAELDAGASTEA